MKTATKQNDEWDKFYDGLDYNDYWIQNDANFESLCVGWCMANNMTLETALEFYRMQVKRGKF